MREKKKVGETEGGVRKKPSQEFLSFILSSFFFVYLRVVGALGIDLDRVFERLDVFLVALDGQLRRHELLALAL